MNVVRKIFLVRRKIDPWLLAAGAAATPLRIGWGPVMLAVFACIGVYMTAARHATARLFAQKFYIFILLYALWSLGLILWRAEPLIDNRQISYTALIAFTAFAGPGMVLIKHPLRALILGARVGILLSLSISFYLIFKAGGRMDMRSGIGNDAVFAFVAAISAITAAIPVTRPRRFLPNGPVWLLAGLIPVLLSQTRAVIAILLLITAVDLVRWASRFDFRRQILIYVALIIAGATILSTGPVSTILTLRFTGMADYLASGDSSKLRGRSSADIRDDLWRGARNVIAEHPVVGVGGYSKMEIVRNTAGLTQSDLLGFGHVHNMVLDELLNDGAVGLIFLMIAFGALFHHLWHTLDERRLRWSLIYFSLVWFVYGMYHNPLLHETTISTIMLFLATYNAQASRVAMLRLRAAATEI